MSADPLEARAQAWWARLQRHPPANRCTAGQLYCGEHWTLAQRAVEALGRAGRPAFLWAASAGYGLVPTHALLSPYSATFAKGAPDSVALNSGKGSKTDQIQCWWNYLATFSGPAPGPRRVRELAEQSPNGAILVVASPDYVRAMRADLLAARTMLSSHELLSVISNRELLSDDVLAPHLIPVDQRSWTVLGGTMQGLNARVALSLLEQAPNAPLTAPHLQEKYESMVRDAEKPAKLNRERMHDKDVCDFLHTELTKKPTAGWTLLLRTLRTSGRACEQDRFRGLHKSVREEILRAVKSEN